MFKFFKELKYLAKLLFKTKPSDVHEIELLEMNCFPFGKYSFMMWCGKMIYNKKNREKVNSLLGTYYFFSYENHEKIHLKQAQKEGKWTSYYYHYLKEWLKGNPFFPPFMSAYYTIPYEMEAYANENDDTYAEQYTGEYLSCYTLKHRKKEYKKYGSPNEWKKFLKTIKKE